MVVKLWYESSERRACQDGELLSEYLMPILLLNCCSISTSVVEDVPA